MTISEDTRALDELCVNTIRTLAMDAVQKANSGHPGTPMALAPLVYVLYTRVMRHNPRDAHWPDRDRFVLSAGHASMLLYSILHLTGYDLSLDHLKSFRQVGNPTAGHPERGDAPGIEMTTGPLGQGISSSVGMALGERMLAARVNRPGHEVVDHHTFVVCSDGDLQEGISHEACALAGHLGLGRLIAFYDDNHISIEGDTSLAMSEDVGARFEAYGWHVHNLGENLELDRLEEATRAAMDVHDRPSLLILRTHIAYGAPNAQDTAEAHGAPLGEEEVRLTKEAYGWPVDRPFHIPGEALAHFRASVERGAAVQAEWEERATAFGRAFPEEWEILRMTVEEGRLPEGWDADPPRFEAGDDPMATRKASQQCIQWVAERIPTFVGGSADLAPSTNTLIKGGGDVAPHSYEGRNLRFGIREHGMGAAVNGLNLHGLRAFGATFLIFSDYMRASVRLAALMHLPSIFVWTHDSIGLGEDGPTHQPIEQLAGLRAMPNLYIVRPADANETARAWRFALGQSRTPVGLALSRQNLPILDPDGMPDDAVERGGYVLRDPAGGEPDLILMGSGAEVHLCTDAADLLERDGLAVRVVSLPCTERFLDQDEAYRESVLPSGVRARVAVEAASTLGWERFVGDHGEMLGMTSFGASGPYKKVFEHFGFTPERVADLGRAAVERLAAA
jgi:transketolase